MNKLRDQLGVNLDFSDDAEEKDTDKSKKKKSASKCKVKVRMVDRFAVIDDITN